jgi:hypothetical protein
MSPITLGILAASGAAQVASYELITSTVLTSTSSSVTFSGLGTSAANYKHLQIRMSGRTTRAVVEDGATIMYFNGDTGANYRSHWLVGTGSSVVSYADTIIGLGSFTGATAGTGQYLPMVMDILDFSSTTKNTTIRMSAGNAGSSQGVRLASGAWFSTAAVTSIALNTTVGSWAAGCRFSLYGLRG